MPGIYIFAWNNAHPTRHGSCLPLTSPWLIFGTAGINSVPKWYLLRFASKFEQWFEIHFETRIEYIRSSSLRYSINSTIRTTLIVCTWRVLSFFLLLHYYATLFCFHLHCIFFLILHDLVVVFGEMLLKSKHNCEVLAASVVQHSVSRTVHYLRGHWLWVHYYRRPRLILFLCWPQILARP